MSPKPRYIHLADRATLALKGPDAKSFLQGILTKDMKGLEPGAPLYALMLTPQGKFLYDMFLTEAVDGTLLMDIEASRKADLLKRLMMYRMRSKVEMADSEALAVYALLGSTGKDQSDAGIILHDPRSEKLGLRALLMKDKAEEHLAVLGFEPGTREEYERLRISLGIPDHQDMKPDKSFPLQYRMDALHAIDFDKGCYVGQEVTARTKHRGSLRRLSFVVEGSGMLPAPGTEVMLNGKPLGELCSTSGNIGIAHLESEELEQSATSEAEASGIQLRIVQPSAS